eukprot:363978-Chlamydomonas_euryale.AAC.5
MPVLSAARQKGPNSGVGAVTRQQAPLRTVLSHPIPAPLRQQGRGATGTAADKHPNTRCIRAQLGCSRPNWAQSRPVASTSMYECTLTACGCPTSSERSVFERLAQSALAFSSDRAAAASPGSMSQPLCQDMSAVMAVQVVRWLSDDSSHAAATEHA